MPLTRDILSKHDQEVLDSIFNPLELTAASASAQRDPDADTDTDLVDIIDEPAAVVQQSKELELAAVRLAEAGQLTEALQRFEAALALTPTRASIYNNRAQCRRLANQDDDAFNDLERAIEMARNSSQPKAKCHALCQRGILYRKCENLDAARTDFEAAANLGSKFAKQQLVEINPFAALCNQMLRQAFAQLK